jgi:thioredoxin reductase
MSRCAVREVDGAGRLERVVLEDLITSTRRTLAAAALFVLIGAEAHTQWLAESIELDSHGFIVTGADLSRQARNAPAWEKLGRDPTCSKPACRACSQPATCAAAQSNE